MFRIERIKYASAAGLAMLLTVPAGAAELQRPPPNYSPPPIWTGPAQTAAQQQAAANRVFTQQVERFNQQRENLLPKTGTTSTQVTNKEIDAAPQGANLSVSDILVTQFPSVSQDSTSAGDYHVRNEHANVQFRVNGIVLPDGVSGFAQFLEPRRRRSNGRSSMRERLMRRLLAIGPAFGVFVMPVMAADIAPYNKAPVPLFNWTGCYVGGELGGAWANQGVLNTSPVAVVVPPAVLTQAPANTTATGGSVIGGGYLGCNYQWMPFVVVGAEGDFNGAGLSATGHAQSLFGGAAAPGGSITWSSKLDSIATVRGRLGFAWTPNTLVYLTGGAAWGRTSYSSTDVFFFGCPACATTSFSNTSTGYVLGGGMEWAPWSNNWIVRAEFLYYNLSGATRAGFVAGIPIAAANPVWSNMAVTSGRAGLSYKF